VQRSITEPIGQGVFGLFAETNKAFFEKMEVNLLLENHAAGKGDKRDGKGGHHGAADRAGEGAQIS
jgi:hypothetical protein